MAFCLFGGVVGTLSGIKFFLESYDTVPFFTLFTLIGPAAYLTVPLQLRLGLPLAPVQYVMMVYSAFFIAGSTYMAGGLLNHAPYFLIAICITSALTTPAWSAVAFNVVAVGIVVWGQYLSGVSGRVLTDFLPAATYADMSLWTLIGLLLVLALCCVPSIFFMREMNRATEQLAEARYAAEEANRTKSDFLAKMSHELRTPMNAILGMTQVMQQSPLGKTDKMSVDVIDQAGTSLLAIINDILDYAKLEAGKLTVSNADFDVQTCAQGVTNLLDVLARQKGLLLTLDIDPNVPATLFGDGKKLHQILMNLIGNALKFTPAGSVQVTIDCPPADDGQLTLHLSVCDTGVGIPKEKLDQVFNEFVQADDSNTRAYGGTGLGLAITKGLVDVMDGDISIESEVNVGTAIHVTLPMVAQAPVQDAVAAA